MNRSLVLLFVSVIVLGLATLVFAQEPIPLPNPLCSGGSGCITTFRALILNITNYISGVIGAVAVLMFIWAGILYLTSGMNPGNVQKANKAVLYAVIGLGIAIAGAGLIELIKYIING